MTAKIETPEDVYVIEPSWRHLPTNDTQQMIAYRYIGLLKSVCDTF